MYYEQVLLMRGGQCIKLPVFFVGFLGRGGGGLSPTPTSFPTASPNIYYPFTCVHGNLLTLDGPSMRIDTVNLNIVYS